MCCFAPEVCGVARIALRSILGALVEAPWDPGEVQAVQSHGREEASPPVNPGGQLAQRAHLQTFQLRTRACSLTWLAKMLKGAAACASAGVTCAPVES